MEQTAAPTQIIIGLVLIFPDSSDRYIGAVIRIDPSHCSLPCYHLTMSDQTTEGSIAPRPKIIQMVCTVCGLDWEDHTASSTDPKITLEVCVLLLSERVKELEQELQRSLFLPWLQPITPIAPFDWGGFSADENLSEYYADPNST